MNKILFFIFFLFWKLMPSARLGCAYMIFNYTHPYVKEGTLKWEDFDC